MKLLENPEIGEIYEITYNTYNSHYKIKSGDDPVRISIWANLERVYDDNTSSVPHNKLLFKVISVSDSIRYNNKLEKIDLFNESKVYNPVNLKIKKIS